MGQIDDRGKAQAFSQIEAVDGLALIVEVEWRIEMGSLVGAKAELSEVISDGCDRLEWSDDARRISRKGWRSVVYVE